MSAHSTIEPFLNISQKDIEKTNKFVGKLFTRLLTEDCPDEANSTYKIGGSTAFEYAFGTAGELAMREITTEPRVNEALRAFEKYADQNKINEVFE